MRWPFARPRAVAVEKIERLDPQSAYRRWAHAYPPSPHNRLMEIEQETMLSLLPDARGLTVLDAGCGSGRYLRQLRDRGASVIGIDLSLPMLEQARVTTSRIARADIRALPLHASSIDLAVCGLALGDVPEIEPALTEIARVLRAGGRIIYSVLHPTGEAAGWSRTFESDGRLWAIDGFWHSVERHRQACAAAGLAIEECREPELAERPDQRAVLVIRAVLRATPADRARSQSDRGTIVERT
jgi:malonyl-CoA O-methyltransferase